jgi:hypothetical protein
MPRTSATIALLLFTTPLTAAETHHVNDAPGFGRAVAAARPGDTILVAPGEYANNFHFRNVRGTAREPVVIAAADPTRPSHHVTLRNIVVRDIGPRGNHDGIKLSGVDDFLVENCTVERWGSGGSGIDMVGCHRGVIARCTFRGGGANGVQAKGGSAEITIRTCRFEDAGERAVNLGGSTGDDSFRPRLTDFPGGGKYEAKDVRVEGCTFVGSGAAVAFVGVDGAVVRYNTIYRPGRYAVRILQERADPGFVPCRNGVFERNVVVFRSDAWVTGGVNVGGNTAPRTFRFANNLWYCEDRPDRSRPTLPVAETDGVTGANPRFVDPARGDFGVRADSPARDRGAHALPPVDPRKP